uniref:Uncharacterized protein n=1 Tax=Amphimedon queenslandica TaxID=400682 RepID=A0A1X7VUN9_AMPQE
MESKITLLPVFLASYWPTKGF